MTFLPTTQRSIRIGHALVWAGLFVAAQAGAQASGSAAGHAHGHSHGATAQASPTAAEASPAQATGSARGEVRKIDLAQGKLTVRHGEIQGLDMPAMTMVFAVRDKRLLDGLKVGDTVGFTVQREGSQYVLIRIER